MKAYQIKTDIGQISYEPVACRSSKDDFVFSSNIELWQRGPRLRFVQKQKAKKSCKQ